MKSTLTFLTMVLASTVCLAHGLTEGKYTGHGLWKSEKTTGQYSITASIGAKKIQTAYILPDGTTKQWDFDIVESTNGFFDVMSQSVKLGAGYCLDKAPVCHYEISAGNLKLEETLVQQDKKLYRYGSKNQGQGALLWQESLDLDIQIAKARK